MGNAGKSYLSYMIPENIYHGISQPYHHNIALEGPGMTQGLVRGEPKVIAPVTGTQDEFIDQI